MDKKILGVLVCVIFGMFGFCYYAGAESVKEYDTEAKVQEAEVIEDVSKDYRYFYSSETDLSIGGE